MYVQYDCIISFYVLYTLCGWTLFGDHWEEYGWIDRKGSKRLTGETGVRGGHLTLTDIRTSPVDQQVDAGVGGTLLLIEFVQFGKGIYTMPTGWVGEQIQLSAHVI